MKKSELIFAFILLPVDIAMILVSFVLAYYLRLNVETSAVFTTDLLEYMKLAVYLLPAWLVVLALNDLYNQKTGKGFFNRIYKIFVSNSVAVLFLVLIMFFSKTLFFSRLILVFIWAISFILIVLGRLLVGTVQNYLLRYGFGRRNLLMVGRNELSQFVANEIKKNNLLGLKVVGVVNGHSENGGELKNLGKLQNLEKIFEKYKINELVLTDAKISRSKVLEIIEKCAKNKVIFKFVPDIFSTYSLKINPSTIGSMQVMELSGIPLDGWGRISKRVFDVVVSFIAIIIAAIPMLLIAFISKISSRGPIVYSHERVGRDGKLFKLYKFRSMYADIEKKKRNYWTKKNDSRVTPFGKILRKTNLDELPQLFNIISGDMSVVGPRPEQPRFVKQFEKEIPDYIKRHRVKAGLTGWAQVNGLKGDTSIAERVRYDMFYIENWSLLFDVKIIIRTIGLIVYEIFVGKYEYRTRS